MPESGKIVINTGPLIALVAGIGDLKFLGDVYTSIIVPYEVSKEILEENATRFGAKQFQSAKWIDKRKKPTKLNPFLKNTLDTGEASVIQLALDENIRTVCIDEALGRRLARLSGLKVTGSLGILLKAKKNGIPINISQAIKNMRKNGIWLNKELEKLVIKKAEEM